MKIIIILLYCFVFFLSNTFSQEKLTRGKEILTGTWHGKEIRYFEQIISFFMKKKIPLDSARTIEKKYGGTLMQYDADDGYSVVEMPKGTDILKRIGELEQDSTLHGISPLVQVIQEHRRTKEQQEQIIKKMKEIQKKMESNPSAVDSADKSSLKNKKKQMQAPQLPAKRSER